MRRSFTWLTLLAAIACAAAILRGLAGPACVIGNTRCMAPTLREGDVFTEKPFDFKRDPLKRFQIITFRSPIISGKCWVMRVVGLPGERVMVSKDSLFINGVEVAQRQLPDAIKGKAWLPAMLSDSNHSPQWELTDDEVFVVGDNLDISNDSRTWGPLKVSSIVGLVSRKMPKEYLWVPFFKKGQAVD